MCVDQIVQISTWRCFFVVVACCRWSHLQNKERGREKFLYIFCFVYVRDYFNPISALFPSLSFSNLFELRFRIKFLFIFYSLILLVFIIVVIIVDNVVAVFVVVVVVVVVILLKLLLLVALLLQFFFILNKHTRVLILG